MGDVIQSDRPEYTSTGRQASVYLRVDTPNSGGRRPVVTTLLEIDPEGYIPREVGLTADGTPTYVTRPGEYGVWNDSPMTRIPPHARVR
jgi:hypothetical protein